MPSRNDYTVGWICALPLEAAAAKLALDVIHEDPSPAADEHDDNVYTTGSVCRHLVVIVCLPAGQYGTNSAATVATQMRRSFKSIRYILVVGIAGGVPLPMDVRLGDVVVSQPTGMAGGVFQYDFGKRIAPDQLKPVGWSSSPPRGLLTVVSNVQSSVYQGQSKTASYLAQILGKDAEGSFVHPGERCDLLFDADYEHLGGEGNTDCGKCDRAKIKTRPARTPGQPKVHYGLIASGNQVMRDSRTRDEIAKNHNNVLCFEMEAAGVAHADSALVIRGICDYADSHKNKLWQGYAAAAAAAYAKELVSAMPPTATTITPAPPRKPTAEQRAEILGALLLSRPEDDRASLIMKKGKRVEGTCQWLASSTHYQSWLEAKEPRLLWISGGPGSGKTMLAIYLTQELERLAASKNAAALFFFCDTQDERRNTTAALLRGLLHQLLEQHSGLMEHIQKYFDAKSRAEYTVMRLAALWDVFKTALHHSRLDEVWCVIDALDECDEESLKLLLENFKIELAELAASHTRLKLVLLSRPQPAYIESKLASFPRLDLDHDSNHKGREDVERYITAKMNEIRLRPGLDDSDLREVQLQLEKSAEGTFLWIGFVVEELKTQKDSYAFRNVLKSVPKELGGMYKRILRRMKNEELPPRILHPVVLARQPLTLAELAAASDINGSTEYPPVKELQSKVASWDSLLRIVGETVQLIHGSAKEFLLSDDLKNDAELEMFRVREENHLDLVKACLDALEGKCSSSSSDVVGGPLLAYASSHWFEHLNLASKTIEDNVNLSREFFSPESATRGRWWKTYWSKAQFGAAPASFTLLHLAAYFGVTAWVEVLLQQSKSHLLHRRILERKDSYGRTPLFWAAGRGHTDVVKLLLKHHSKVNTRDKDRLTPLHIAVTAEHAPVVQLLLDNNADIEAKAAGGNTPLARAIEGGSKEMIILLLSRGAEMKYLYPQPQLHSQQDGIQNTAEALLAHCQGELLFRRFERRFKYLQLFLETGVFFLQFKPVLKLFTKLVNYQLERREANNLEVLRKLTEKHRSTGLRRAGKPVIVCCEKVIDRKDIHMLNGLLVPANRLFTMALTPGCEDLLEQAAIIAMATLQRAANQEFRAGLELLAQQGSKSLTIALNLNKQEVLDQAVSEALQMWYTAVSEERQRDALDIMESGWALYMAVFRDNDMNTIDHCIKLYVSVLQRLLQTSHADRLFDDIAQVLCKEATRIIDRQDINAATQMGEATLLLINAADDDLLEFLGSALPAALDLMLDDSLALDTVVWFLGATALVLKREIPLQQERVQVRALKSLVECMLLLKRAYPDGFNQIWETAQEILETAVEQKILQQRDIDQVSFQVFGAQPFYLV
ncbi:hypothetical protein BJX63DRAFT_242411 [Aspergillus granulosus]|uniref:NACHT domain-containing protein n=1 Tax=Aspergillus granulosus TaxID=176169 RepID=A0ABR4HAI3_9EURO